MQLVKFFARFNPFVRTARSQAALTAKPVTDNDIYRTSYEPLIKRSVNKQAISAPQGFINKTQGERLLALMAPTLKPVRITVPLTFPKFWPASYKNGIRQTPPSLAEVLAHKGRGLPPGLTPTQGAWVVWNYPVLDMTINVDDAYLAGAAWPRK